MRRRIGQVLLPLMLMGIVMLGYYPAGHAQGEGVLVLIHGEPEGRTSPPQVHIRVSVVNKATGASVENLSPDQFQVLESGVRISDPVIHYEQVGLAIVVVLDLGGIAVPGDPRLKEATDLARQLTERLNLSGGSTDDRITLVAVGKDGALTLEEMDPTIHDTLDFPYTADKVAVLNTLTLIEGQTVKTGITTPLYEGLEKAIWLLDASRSPQIADLLGLRRKVIFVLSDGGEGSSNDTTREIVTRKAREKDISIYTIGLAKRGGSLSKEGDRNLRILAYDTNGLPEVHNITDESRARVLDLFNRVLTQRMQYQITYITHLRKGKYELKIVANTPWGAHEDSATLSSILEPFRLELVSPSDGLQVTVPYSTTAGMLIPSQVRLAAQVTLVDGVPREPAEVRYFVDGTYVGTGVKETNYAFDWEVGTLVTATETVQRRDFTIKAEAVDPYLSEKVETSTPVNIRVTWEAYPWWPDGFRRWIGRNWGIIAGYAALFLGIVFLTVVMIRTRGELARRVVQRTTGVMKGLTQLLTPDMARPWGKMVVLQGNVQGREFLLTKRVIRFGREPHFCDYPLYDDYVSNPHFTLFWEERGEVYIQDEESKNKTRVDGNAIPSKTRQPLSDGAVIDAGMTRLRFERLDQTKPQVV